MSEEEAANAREGDGEGEGEGEGEKASSPVGMPEVMMHDSFELTVGDAVEVEADGEWWDAIVKDAGDGKVCVHYIGGTEEEDEVVDVTSGRLRQAKKLEVVWAKGSDGIAWPAAVLEGSLADPSCLKLRVRRFLIAGEAWIRREQAAAFTQKNMPKRSSSKKMTEAIDAAQAALTKGTLAAMLANALELEAKEASAAPAPKKKARKSVGGDDKKDPTVKKAGSQAERRHQHRLSAMRKLGLCAPAEA